MKKVCLFVFLGLGAICGVGYAEEGPVCHMCEKIREYNAAHPENNYYWYDDYLKEKKENEKPATAQQQTTKQPSATENK